MAGEFALDTGTLTKSPKKHNPISGLFHFYFQRVALLILSIPRV
jgi:hypothetical protein